MSFWYPIKIFNLRFLLVSNTLILKTSQSFTTSKKRIKHLKNGYNANYKDETSTIWAIRNGYRPLAIPLCGFNNTCPPSPLFYASIGVASIFLFTSIIFGLGLAIYLWVFYEVLGNMKVVNYRFQRQKLKRLNALWQIPYMFLQKPESKKVNF